MDLQTPFVRPHFDTRAGTVFLATTCGQLHTVAQCWARGTRDLLYEACPRFIAAYSGTIDMGLVLRWTSQSGMDAWLHRVIYFSFLLLAEDSEL